MRDELLIPDFWNRLKNLMRSPGNASGNTASGTTKCSFRHDASGITGIETRRNGTVRSVTAGWNEISKAIAYKKDCWTVDLICIAFFCHEGSFVVTEEMDCWKNLVEQLPRYLPGCKLEQEWWPTVAFPAFVENATLIYDRK